MKLRPLWSLTASHECLEMLTNPLGDRVIVGPSPAAPDHQVELLVEICDPVQAPAFGYRIGNVLVSDFVTPSYFDFPPGFVSRYSFCETESTRAAPGPARRLSHVVRAGDPTVGAADVPRSRARSRRRVPH